MFFPRDKYPRFIAHYFTDAYFISGYLVSTQMPEIPFFHTGSR